MIAGAVLNGEPVVECPLCDEALTVKYTKNKKPYIQCNECGMQMFIRKNRGVTQIEFILGEEKVKDHA